jgi:hypothetical protein
VHSPEDHRGKAVAESYPKLAATPKCAEELENPQHGLLVEHGLEHPGLLEVTMRRRKAMASHRLVARLTRKRDVKQFRQACREMGLTVAERHAASEALHAEKEISGKAEHLSYGDLLAWLRQWRQR